MYYLSMMIFTISLISSWDLPSLMAFTMSATFTTLSPLISPLRMKFIDAMTSLAGIVMNLCLFLLSALLIVGVNELMWDPARQKFMLVPIGYDQMTLENEVERWEDEDE